MTGTRVLMSEYKRQILVGAVVALVATLGFAFELNNYVAQISNTTQNSSSVTQTIGQTVISPTCPLSAVECLHQTALVSIAILQGAANDPNSDGFSLPGIATLAVGGNNSSISIPTGFCLSVAWTNNDKVPHELSIYAGGSACLTPKLLATSGEIYPGKSYVYTFHSLGSYSYRDDNLSWMVGFLNIAYENSTVPNGC
jgi:hypothetical protein